MSHRALATAQKVGDRRTNEVGPTNATSVACATLPWRDGSGRTRITTLVKATFALRPGDIAETAPPLPLCADVPFPAKRAGDRAALALETASDFVPLKPHAEVFLVGKVVPRPGVARQAVGFAIARGADVLLGRALVAVAGRPKAGGPRGLLEAFPATFAHTWGGPGVAENPAGSSDDEAASSPRLVDPDHPRAPASFGPIASAWPQRRQRLSEAHAPFWPPKEGEILTVPRDLDLRFFQAAPPEQWLAPLRGGERLLLMGFHAAGGDGDAIVCALPSLHAFAQIRGPGVERRSVPLAGDTLWIDTDQMVATVTFRGSIPIERRHAEAACAPNAFTIRAGLAPCEDVEAVFAEPVAWRAERARSPQKTSPSVDPISVDNATALAAATLAFHVTAAQERRAVIVKGTFGIPADGSAVVPVDPQPPLHGDEFAGGSAPGEDRADRAELVRASDFVPFKTKTDVILRGTAHAPAGKSTALVSLTLGPARARIAALGPRAWGADGVPRPAGAFAPVPLRWAHAFGGPGFAANPVGTGVAEGSAPPLLEDPDRLLRTRTDRVTPAAVGPISPTWDARRKLLGTFDAAWIQDGWPALPRDADPACFQAAPEAMRCAFLRGDETFRAESLRAEGIALEGALPGLLPRAFVVRDGAEPHEVPLNLDTVVLDGDAATVALTWRGVFDPAPSAAAGHGAESGRRAAIAPATVMVFDDDLAAPASHDDLAARIEARRARLLAGPEVTTAPPPSYALSEVLDRAERPPRGKKPAIALAIAVGATVFAAAREKPLPKTAPPPPTRAEVDAMLAAGKDLRKVDLAGADLGDIDLSGRDLTGARLSLANLAGARLTGANLTAARLAGVHAPGSQWDGANLERADLTGAMLAGATLSRAKLGLTKLAEANLEGALLEGAEGEQAGLGRAHVAGASFGGATLPKLDLAGAHGPSASFKGARLTDAKFLNFEGEKASFEDAHLGDARFQDAKIPGAIFTNAAAKGVVLEQCDLTGAVFRKADLSGAVLNGATLVKADLTGILGREAMLKEAVLTGARLDGADLMRASLEAADLRGASLVGANLYQAETWRAIVGDTDLTGAHIAGTKLATGHGA